MARKLSRSRIAYGSPQTRRFDSCSSTRHLRRQKPRQLFATAGVSAEKGDMILERTAKGQTVFAQLLYAPRLTAQSAHAAPTQSRYTCDGAMKWYLLPAQAMPRVSLMTGHLRTSITVEIVSPGPSRATIEARPERAADRAPAHGRTSLPPERACWVLPARDAPPPTADRKVPGRRRGW